MVWESVIGQHGDADVKDNGRLLLQACCFNALCNVHHEHFFPTQRFAQVHRFAVQRFFGSTVTIDFYIVSAYLFISAVDVSR